MGPEFQLIEAFVEAAAASPRAPEGPGDDAAVLRRRAGDTCVTVDAVVEGVHFRRASAVGAGGARGSARISARRGAATGKRLRRAGPRDADAARGRERHGRARAVADG